MSSVPKSQRKQSELEFYATAIRIRKEVTFILLRDFGVKDKIRSMQFVPKNPNVSDEDIATMQSIVEKYDLKNPIVDVYPSWFIADARKSISDLLRTLIQSIVSANSIYPTSIPEYHQRRALQNEAIAACVTLEQEFQFIIEILPVNLEKYRNSVLAIESEIKLLKAWRKSDNRLLKGILKTSKQTVTT